MQLIQTIQGSNYKITGHNLKTKLAKEVLIPGTALRVIVNSENNVIVHIRGNRYVISLSEAKKIRVNPI